MRADRLIATLLLMQSRGRVTAAEVATELEVSVATARRDLEALSAAGIPVYPQPGRGGGWALVGGARTDLSGLSASEAQALFLLAGPAAAVSDDAKSALRKLVRALPQTFRADAEAAAGATTIDPARWGERDRPRSPTVDLLQSAVVRRRRVRFAYARRGAEAATRTVDPWGLAAKDDVWYLIAGTDRGQRTFRVDRMSDVVATDETFERPANFDLDEAWAEVVDQMEGRRSTTTAVVLVPTRFLDVLQHHFGRHLDVLGEDGDRTRVRVAAGTPLDIARDLAGWGTMVEVLEPRAVQAQLGRIGAELAERYPERATVAEGLRR